LTTDGGLKWLKIADGPHLIKVLDDIGILVLVPFNEATNEIKYSLDYGIKTMNTVRFTPNKNEDKYLVRSILKDVNYPMKIYLYVES
jgi:hypothetical protein